jgi:hypothetical protein
VSGLAIFKGSEAAGVVANRAFGVLDTRPQHVGFTLNSDTPTARSTLTCGTGRW